jgi:hypothetical protein
LLRLPETPNRKYPDAPPVRLLQHSDVRFDPRAMEKELPPVPTAERAPIPKADASGAADAAVISERNLSRAASRVWTGESVKRTADGRLDRSASLVWITRILYGMGASRSAIVAALAERDAAFGWRKYVDRPDAEEQYHRIVDAIERGTHPQRF